MERTAPAPLSTYCTPDAETSFDLILGFEPGANDPDDGDWTRARAVWTVTQVARAMTRCGVETAVSTVRGWCEQGLLAAVKTSARGHWRIAAADLAAYLGLATVPTPTSTAAA